MYKATYISMLWVMMQELIFTMNSLVDIACINGVSDDALVGATFAMTIINLMYNTYTVFAKGARVLVSKYFGAQDENNMQSTLMTATIVCVFLAIVQGTLFLLFGNSLLSLFSLSKAQEEQAYAYMLARLPGFFFFSFSSPICRCAEGRGQIARLVKFRVVNLLNIPFSIILMQFLGVAGVGWGTTLTELAELIVLYTVFKPKFRRPTKRNFKEVLGLGASYLPESMVSPLTNTFLNNLCLTYLSTAQIVLSQLVNKLYDCILNIMYVSTQHVELTVGHEYGAGNREGIIREFKLFRHCYIRLLVLHIPVTMLVGLVYLGIISHVENLGLALILLLVRLLFSIPFYIELPARRMLYIFNVIKPVMWVRFISLVVPKLAFLYLSLRLGAEVFCLPICYMASDLPCMLVNTYLIRKGGYLKAKDGKEMCEVEVSAI